MMFAVNIDTKQAALLSWSTIFVMPTLAHHHHRCLHSPFNISSNNVIIFSFASLPFPTQSPSFVYYHPEQHHLSIISIVIIIIIPIFILIVVILAPAATFAFFFSFSSSSFASLSFQYWSNISIMVRRRIFSNKLQAP
jgi:hypothetical protein